MNLSDEEQHKRDLLYFCLGLFTGMILILIGGHPASAAYLENGTLYWADIPTNDLYESQVMPGDTLALGRTYDLTKVKGSSEEFAWWGDTSIEGTTCTPDQIISISYVHTGGRIHPDNVTLDPADGWKPGHWWQWDGCYQKKFDKEHPDPQYSVYMADDNLMFTIIKDPHPPTPVPTPTPTPVPTPKKVYTLPPTPVPVPTPIPDPPATIYDYLWIPGVIVGIVVLYKLW